MRGGSIIVPRRERYVWRTTQTHRLYMNGSNEVMFDTVVYKILTDPRQVIAGRLRSAREADRLEKKKDEPRFYIWCMM